MVPDVWPVNTMGNILSPKFGVQEAHGRLSFSCALLGRPHVGAVQPSCQWIGFVGKIFTGNQRFSHIMEFSGYNFPTKPIHWSCLLMKSPLWWLDSRLFIKYGNWLTRLRGRTVCRADQLCRSWWWLDGPAMTFMEILVPRMYMDPCLQHESLWCTFKSSGTVTKEIIPCHLPRTEKVANTSTGWEGHPRNFVLSARNWRQVWQLSSTTSTTENWTTGFWEGWAWVKPFKTQGTDRWLSLIIHFRGTLIYHLEIHGFHKIYKRWWVFPDGDGYYKFCEEISFTSYFWSPGVGVLSHPQMLSVVLPGKMPCGARPAHRMSRWRLGCRDSILGSLVTKISKTGSST